MAVGNFWRHVDTSAGPDGCWVWTGAHTCEGYGQFRDGDKIVLAHRYIFEAVTGETLAPGVILRHSCDNPPCVQPLHLLPGTQLENMADRERAGHTPRGEKNGRAILSDLQALEMRMQYLLHAHTIGELAILYGISPRAVRHIVSGNHYSHLNGLIYQVAPQTVRIEVAQPAG